MVLGGFFYGYLLTNFLGGRLADRFGGRLIYGAGVTLTAFLTIISPSAARYSTKAFMIVRVLEGMTEVRMCVCEDVSPLLLVFRTVMKINCHTICSC